MSIRIEDCFEDVLAKAQAGLGLSDKELAKNSGESLESIRTLKGGEFNEESARATASALDIDPSALCALAGGWRPSVTAPKGLFTFNTAFPVPGYEEMTVNAYLICDPVSKQAVAFDTGADASAMIAKLEELGASLTAILITHAHSDHVKDLLTLKETTGAEAFAPEDETVAGAKSFEPGKEFLIGELVIQTVETSGHSSGGVTYLVRGLERPVAIVGDAIFAGSAGGAAKSWKSALKMIHENILSLPSETVLCPGHGPLTTVGDELANNPFFANTEKNGA